jgi:hypothetical protein
VVLGGAGVFSSVVTSTGGGVSTVLLDDSVAESEPESLADVRSDFKTLDVSVADSEPVSVADFDACAGISRRRIR